jgi:ATP-dependent Clp protease ATP-binding subunit ClpC
LESLGLSLEDVRGDVEEIIGQGQSVPSGEIPFTPRAKKVLELSLRESLQLGHNYIGTEHVLLGLVREGEGVGAQVLQKRGADLDGLRAKVVSLLSGFARESEIGTETEGRPLDEPLCPRCRGRLAETAAYRTMDVAAVGEGEPRVVTFAFCRVCGNWLGTVS